VKKADEATGPALPAVDLLSRAASPFADMLVALGVAAGSLSQDHLLHALADSVRSGSLHHSHLTYLRDKIDAVLREAAAPMPPRH